MISLKSKREIETMAKAGKILQQVFVETKKMIRSGLSTRDVDVVAEKTIRSLGGKPAFKGYQGFPGTACISVNEEVVHGIPGSRILNAGDLITVDCGVDVDGYFVDAARTWIVDDINDPEKERLIAVAKESFEAGVNAFKPGARVGDLSAAIQAVIEGAGFQVVRDFVGHGIGTSIHEDPQVPNYGKPGRGPKIEEGLCIAIEPMVTVGNYAVETLKDGWTVVTRDRSLSSHYEDTIAFTADGPQILTR